MKKIIKTSIERARNAVRVASCFIIAGLFALLAIPARAFDIPTQVPEAPSVFYLTNSTTFTLLTGGTNIATGGTVIIDSKPFPIFKGRGFVMHSDMVATSSVATGNVTFDLQTATPVTSPAGTLVTNWSTANDILVSNVLNGTTRQFGRMIIPPTAVDNDALCRLHAVTSAHTNTISINPTNTFADVFK